MRLTRAGQTAVTNAANRYAYDGRRMRQMVSPRRRWIRFTGAIAVARAAAPDGGYLAAAGRYVYRGRRSQPAGFPLRRNTRLMAIAGAMLSAIVLAAIVFAVNATVKPSTPSAEPALPAVPNFSYPPPDAEPTLTPPSDPATGLTPTDPGGIDPTPGDPFVPTATGPAPGDSDSPSVPADDVPGTARPGATTAPPPRAPAPVNPPATTKAPAPNPPAQTRSYEAEAAYLYGASVTNERVASGGKVVRVADSSRSRDRRRTSTGAVHFTRVSAAKNGRYAMTVYYLSSDTRDAAMLVNGRQSRTLRLSANGRTDNVRSATFTVDLVAGYNSITFGIPGNRAPKLDRITVRG